MRYSNFLDLITFISQGIREGKEKDVINLAGRAVNLFPESLHLHLLYAHILSVEGYIEKARKEAETASYLEPEAVAPLILQIKFALWDDVFDADKLSNLVNSALPKALEDKELLKILLISGKKLGWNLIGHCKRENEFINGWVIALEPLKRPLRLNASFDYKKQLLNFNYNVPLFDLIGIKPPHTAFHYKLPDNIMEIRIFHEEGELSGSPLYQKSHFLDYLRKPYVSVAKSLKKGEKIEKITVIVPVYRGFEATRETLESLMTQPCKTKCRILVVNDNSPEENIRNYVESLARTGLIELLTTKRNLGFVGAINNALNYCADGDVVLLNSDVKVMSGWLDRLFTVAKSSDNVGMVVPFSNNAEHLSFPFPMNGNPYPDNETFALLDKLASQVNKGCYIEIPQGIGFCMYINRKVLDIVKAIDDRLISNGYGDDVDLSIRIRQAGLKILCATDLFVAHRGNVSFGGQKRSLAMLNMRRIYGKYKGSYEEMIDFLAEDPLKEARYRLEEARLASPKSPCLIILGIISEINFFEEIKRITETLNIQANHENLPVILCPVLKKNGGFGLMIYSTGFDLACPIIYNYPEDLHKLFHIIKKINVKMLILKNLGDFPFEVIDFLIKLDTVNSTDIEPVDYSLWCPRRNMIDGNGFFCNDPHDKKICVKCLKNYGHTVPFFSSYRRYSQLMSSVINKADKIFAHTNDMKKRISRRFSGQSHKISLTDYINVDSENISLKAYETISPLNILTLGVTDHTANALHFRKFVRYVAENDMPFRFVVPERTLFDNELINSNRAWVIGLDEPPDFEKLEEIIELHNCKSVFVIQTFPDPNDRNIRTALKFRLPLAKIFFNEIEPYPYHPQTINIPFDSPVSKCCKQLEKHWL